MADAATIESTTRDVIRTFVSGWRMFTALDVSNDVKLQLNGVRHREISPFVRALFDKGAMGSDYERTSIDVEIPGGRTVQALLYHPKGEDPNGYGQYERSQRAVAPTAGSPSTAAASSSTGSNAPTSDGGSFRGPLGTGPSASPAPAATPASPTPAPRPAPAAAPIGDSLELTIAGDGSAAVPAALLERAGIDADTVALDVAGMGAAITLSDPEFADDPLDELDVGAVVRIPAAYMSAFGGDTVYARVDGDRVTVDR